MEPYQELDKSQYFLVMGRFIYIRSIKITKPSVIKFPLASFSNIKKKHDKVMLRHKVGPKGRKSNYKINDEKKYFLFSNSSSCRKTLSIFEWRKIVLQKYHQAQITE